MSTHALVIHPNEIDFAPEERFIDALRACGFLGEMFDLFGTCCFRPGERFFECIQFESSHSVIELTPSSSGELVESQPRDSREFTQIELRRDDKPGFLCGCNIQIPRCPKCQFEVEDWGALVSAWYESKQDWVCPSCHGQFAAYALDWQHTAGFARYWIEIRQIHEGEATPSEEFLRLLEAKTAREWRYFWFHL
jgi:hypothetical protein